jgi:nitrite reductase (NADH) large subunit
MLEHAADLLVIGNGVAGVSAALAARRQASLPANARILIVRPEPHAFYYRAALTNFLLGELSREELQGLPHGTLKAQGIEELEDFALELDAGAKVVRFASGRIMRYGKLLIASGASARMPDASFAATPGAFGLRTLEDALGVLERMPKARRAVVLGGGILGLEVAEALHHRGIGVQVVHRGAALLDRVVDATSGELIRRRMEQDGVEVLLKAPYEGLETANGELRAVRLGDGRRLDADLVVSCIGAAPNTAWLEQSGITLARGGMVPVDRHLAVRGLTEVYAAGDCAAVDESGLPSTNPSGLWQPARYQGRVAGRNMAQSDPGKRLAYAPGVLLNSTRAWQLSIDSAGAHPGGEGLERIHASHVSDKGPVHKCAAFRDGRLAGFVLLGDRREARALHALLDLREAPKLPNAVRERLFDPNFDLHAWVAAQSRAAGAERWSQRGDDALTVEAQGSNATGGHKALPGFGMTSLARSAAPEAQRPLYLEVSGERVELRSGPVRVGAHREARWGRDEALPRGASLALEPMGLAWLATAEQVAPSIRINGAVLRQPQFLAENDVIEVGKWRALVQPAKLDAAAPASAPRASGWLVGPVHRHALVGDGTTRIGRLPDNDLVLEGEGIGNFHAQVVARDGAWLLVDCGSPKGITVNDREGADFLPLQPGDRIRLGTQTWRFEVGEALAAESASGAISGYLCPENGPDAGRALAIRLRNGQAMIGRGESVELRLSDPLVSRRHACLRQLGSGLAIVDQGSANGVLVNGQRVDGDAPLRLVDGDELRLGAHSYRFSKSLPLGRRIGPASAPVKAEGTLGSTVLASSKRQAAAEKAADWHLCLEPQPNAVLREMPRAELHEGQSLRIGRDPSGEGVHSLRIPAITVSRQHAEVEFTAQGPQLRDLGSREGTRLNGELVGATPVRLHDSDRIVFGHVAEFEVRFVRESATAPAEEIAAPAQRRTLSRQPLSPAFWLSSANALETDLRALVETELDACIGCHACMRACPLPDAGNVSIAALNQAAASGRILDPRAQKFVQDCTQCRQCVPVCPVNIERSRIVLWNKLKLDVDAEARPPMQAGEGSAAMAQTVAQIAAQHRDHVLLGALTERDRIELLSRCQYRRLSDGEALLLAGNYVSTLWLVHAGAIDWQLPLAGDEQLASLHLGEGQTIALREFVADEACERNARAAGTAIAIGLPRALVAQFARRAPAFRDALTTGAASFDVFQRVPALAKLDAAARKQLEAEAELALAAPGEVLRAFGNEAVSAYVLRGFVAEHEHAGATELDSGAVRGYHRTGAHLRLEARDAPSKLRAKTACELLLVPARLDAGLLGGANTFTQLQALPSGKRIMAIEVAKCVDCNNCVDACGRRHGHSRLDRRTQGVQVAGKHIPSACYHCEDPKCLLCDTGGIVREASGEIRIVEENCIGCGSCASRCPYDNIRMVPREAPKAPGALGSLLELLKLREPAPVVTSGPRLAVKCDLCVGHEDGPACVRACPTGAAQRLSLAEIAGEAVDTA